MLRGRDPEQAAIEALLAGARQSRSGVLLLRGQAGVGKTALLDDARERGADMRVLGARGVESESDLPFAGLHQFLRPVLSQADGLPPRQSAALLGALGLADHPGEDRFLISLACLTLVAELAEEQPVLCLVDDAQWLDSASADALSFVARRLHAERVVMLFTVRDGDARRFEARELPELEVGALDAMAATAIVEACAGAGLAPAVRDALVEQAAGNALALQELPSALTPEQLAGREPLPGVLPLTQDVERLFGTRVARLPERTQRLLRIVAADDSGRLDAVIDAAHAEGIAPEALTPAEDASLVAVRGSRIEVRHPLVRSAIVHGASLSDRRSAHLALAGAFARAGDDDQEAWHRAAAALGPDADVADALERTAERARRRSGHGAAASALERAAELSTGRGERARRLVTGARAAWMGGRPERAVALLDRVDAPDDALWMQAEMAHLRGLLDWRCGRLSDAGATLMAGAERIAPADPDKALEMLVDAGFSGLDAGDYARVAEAGRRAAALPRSGEPKHAFLATLMTGVGTLVEAGDAAQTPRLLGQVARAAEFDDPRLLAWASVGAQAAGDPATEDALLRRAEALARASAAVPALTIVLVARTVGGFFNGRVGLTPESEEGLALSREAGLSNATSCFLAVLAWLDAMHGDEDACRAHAAEARAGATIAGSALAASIAEWALAMLDVAAGRPEDAVTRLDTLRTSPPGTLHAYVLLVAVPDYVEACVRAGRKDQARAAVAVLERFDVPGAPAWGRAHAARARGVVAADETAEAQFAEALRLYGELGRPFDHARTELLLGEWLRRQRRRVEARDHLRSAIDRFDALRARPWAERAQAGLRASGQTARKREVGAAPALTPQELQVARFVAQGLSNKEVAAQLFLSPRTIDAHLRSVYAKLGITSRTQLARLPLDGDGALAAPAATPAPA